jgi:acyl-CoA thioester hydrolase
MKNKISIDIRIDWSELDLFGHVNNVSFFKYIQASRINFWETSGLTELFTNENKGPLLAACSCRFLKPLFYPGNIRIEIENSFVKTTSFGLRHTIKNDAGESAAEAEDVVVLFDYNTNEKILLTARILDELNKIS